MNKKLIYTVIFGDGYRLHDPETVCDGWDYVCVTDRDDLRSSKWTIQKVVLHKGHSVVKNSRLYKIMPMKTRQDVYDVTIYIDSKFKPINNLDKFLGDSLGENNMALMDHNKRSCVYDELRFLSKKNIITDRVAKGIIEKYKRFGMPKGFGLFSPGVFVRKNNVDMAFFESMWWREYLEGCERDMVSLAYTMWLFENTLNFNVSILPFRETYKRFSP